jgi:hypothetical protein
MGRADSSMTDPQRLALREAERLFDEWRRAKEAVIAAESRLWEQALAAPGGQPPPALAAETLRLRQVARDAHARLTAALADLPS